MKRWLADELARIPLRRGRLISSVGLCLAHMVLAVTYVVPALSIPPPVTTPPGRVSIVNHIDGNGPWLVVAFALSAVALAVAVWTRRGLQWAHALGATVCGGFATASLIGAFASNPNRPIVTAVFAAAVCAAHWGLSDAYGDQVVRR